MYVYFYWIITREPLSKMMEFQNLDIEWATYISYLCHQQCIIYLENIEKERISIKQSNTYIIVIIFNINNVENEEENKEYYRYIVTVVL